jgi:hypothetical protein
MFLPGDIIFENHDGRRNDCVYPRRIIMTLLSLNDQTMQTSPPSHSDKPQSKALYIPGPFVASIKALIDAYREGNIPALSSALQELQQEILDAEPKPKPKPNKPRPVSKSKSKPLRKEKAAAAQEGKPFSRKQKAVATESPMEAEYTIDLVSRLNRDHPAIAERYAMGEFKTIQEAAIAAGIIVESSPPSGKNVR